jgi:hypothetical protein
VRKLSQSEVQKIFEDQGCSLLSQYKDSNTSLEYVCSCGNKAKNNLKRFKAGARCKKCGYEKSSRKRSFDYRFVKSFFEENDCQLISVEYNNCFELLDYKCSCGNLSQICFSNFKSGHRCRKCTLKIGDKNHKWNSDRQAVKNNESLRKRCYNILHRSLKATNSNKDAKTSQMLGFTCDEFRDWIQQDRFKTIIESDWHLDHVFPIKAFIDYGITDLKLINCLDNLQPVPKKYNLTKQARYSKKRFEIWLLERGFNDVEK